MNTFIKKTALALAVGSILGLSACNEPSTLTPVVVDKSTSGVITGFGSVFINGVEYETDDATFVVDGVEGDESLLKLGMVVSLSGSDAGDGTGNALSIDFDDDVEGVVIASDLDANGLGTLNIMGVTVTVDEDTVFESNASEVLTLVDITEGNIIEVSGHSSGEGQVWATRIEVKSAVLEQNKEMEVKGKVTLLDETAKTFTLGGITVDYSGATLEDDFVIANDLFVEVKSNEGFTDLVLAASKIELKDGGQRGLDHDDSDDETELEGVITKVTSATLIEINGHAVLLSDSTRYVHKPTTFLAGMKIKVKGDVDVDGNLVAEKIIFKPSGDLKLKGKITATDIVANTVTVFGISIKLDNSTLVKDDRDDDDLGIDSKNVKYKFGVDDLAVGNWIKIKAYTSQNDGLVATKLERETFEEGDKDKLEGKLTIVAATDTTAATYTIEGIPVNLDNVGITATDGHKLELKGSFSDGVFTALEGETKDEDAHYIGGNDGDESDLDKKESHDDDDKDDDKDDENKTEDDDNRKV